MSKNVFLILLQSCKLFLFQIVLPYFFLFGIHSQVHLPLTLYFPEVINEELLPIISIHNPADSY